MKEFKERDEFITNELGIKSLARLIGYNEVGEPIELVYDVETNRYDWHVGGEYSKKATQQSIQIYAAHFNQCPVV